MNHIASRQSQAQPVSSNAGAVDQPSRSSAASIMQNSLLGTRTSNLAAMIELQRTNYPAYVARLNPILDAQDRSNPFAYSLGADIPIEIKRQVYAEWKSGQNSPNVEIRSMSGGNASFDEGRGRNGTISINADLFLAPGAIPRLGQMEAFAAWGHMEEIGHWGDMRAQQLLGRPGGDSVGDEGARFAYSQMGSLIANRNPHTFLANYSIRSSDGTERQFSVDTVVLKALASEKIASGSFATENRIGNVENFGPEGHYQTTYLTAMSVAVSMGISGRRADEMANRMALGSQLPDMLANYDAFSQFKAKSGDLLLDAALGVGGIRAQGSNWTPAEQTHLENVYEGLHALPRGDNATTTWLVNERAETRRFIIDNIAAGNFLEAGVAIHRFGDLHAHVRPNGVSYSGDIGHGGAGHTPDYLYTQNWRRQAQPWNKVTNYQRSLAGVMAQGMAGYQSRTGNAVSQQTIGRSAAFGVQYWSNTYNTALSLGARQARWYGNGASAAEVTENLFRNLAGRTIQNFHNSQHGAFAPLSIPQMEVGGGYNPTRADIRALETVMARFK